LLIFSRLKITSNCSSTRRGRTDTCYPLLCVATTSLTRPPDVRVEPTIATRRDPCRPRRRAPAHRHCLLRKPEYRPRSDARRGRCKRANPLERLSDGVHHHLNRAASGEPRSSATPSNRRAPSAPQSCRQAQRGLRLQHGRAGSEKGAEQVRLSVGGRAAPRRARETR
jgi:hypothetical protein